MAEFEDWKMIPTMVLGMTQGRMRLTLTIANAGHQWMCVALESPSSDTLDTREAMETFIGEHAHKALPVQASLRAAMALAEKYAFEWGRDRAQLCACEEIKPVPKWAKSLATLKDALAANELELGPPRVGGNQHGQHSLKPRGSEPRSLPRKARARN